MNPIRRQRKSSGVKIYQNLKTGCKYSGQKELHSSVLNSSVYVTNLEQVLFCNKTAFRTNSIVFMCTEYVEIAAYGCTVSPCHSEKPP